MMGSSFAHLYIHVLAADLKEKILQFLLFFLLFFCWSKGILSVFFLLLYSIQEHSLFEFKMNKFGQASPGATYKAKMLYL